MDADGDIVETASLQGKKIGIYFSAEWCPPCTTFTPVLVDAYNTWQNDGKPMAVVFVSFDNSEEAMFGYMQDYDMPWKAVPFGSDKIDELSNKYDVGGIPALIIIDEQGDIITTNGTGDVSRYGADAWGEW